MIFVTGYPDGGTRVPMMMLDRAGARIGSSRRSDQHDTQPLVNWGIENGFKYVKNFDLADTDHKQFESIVRDLRDQDAIKAQSYMLPLLADRFDDLKVIHITRDGRDLAYRNRTRQTHKQFYFLGRSNTANYLKDTMRDWSCNQLFVVTYCAGLDYLHTRLEDVVADPVNETLRILDFCGYRMLDDVSWIQAGTSLGKWKKLKIGEVCDLEKIGGDMLERLGYGRVC